MMLWIYQQKIYLCRNHRNMQYSKISGMMTPPHSCAMSKSTSSDVLMKESSLSNEDNDIQRCCFDSIRPPWLETNVHQHNHWSNVEHLQDVSDRLKTLSNSDISSLDCDGMHQIECLFFPILGAFIHQFSHFF